MNFFKINSNRFSGHNKVYKITVLGMLLALIFVIHSVTDLFAWTSPSFLHFDFSLIPIIVALFIFDFWTALGLLLMRLGYSLALSHDGVAFWYGPLMQLQVALVSIIVIALAYKPLLKAIKRPAVALMVALVMSVIFEVVYSSLMNWSWSTPLYMKLRGDYHGDINPSAFGDWYAKLGFVQTFFGGFKSWDVAAWGAFAPFNAIKFSVVAFVAFPLIKVTYVYFTGTRMTTAKIAGNKVIDSHVHISWTEDSHKNLIKKAKENEIEMIAVSSSVEDMERTAIYSMNHGLRFGLGIAYNFKSKDDILHGMSLMDKYKTKMSFVGEIGLDYDQYPKTKKKQLEVFKAQVEFAKQNGMAISIHGKGKSYEDIISILNELNFNNKVILHNYNGDVELTKSLLKNKKFYFSFGNQAFYKEYKHVIESIKVTPLSRLLVETDSPGFPTIDNLGKTEFDKQDSTNVFYVVKRISEIKNISESKLTKKTKRNINKALA